VSEFLVAVIVFACLSAASLVAMLVTPSLPERHRHDETAAVVRLIANIFVVMTSLVFGLMINSAKNSYTAIDASVHAFGTNLVLIDRSLRSYGIHARDARASLAAYVEEAIAAPARVDDSTSAKPDTAGAALDRFGNALMSLDPADDYHADLLADIRQQYRRLYEQRWSIVEQSEGAIPMPLIAMLVTWLMLIFGSFGYRAPRNVVVVGSFLLSSALIAGAFYLVLNMDVPFSGPIQISDAPLRRALAEMRM